MCLIVLIFSLVDYFTSFKITQIWIVEPIGFAYGIIAAKYNGLIKNWLKDHWKRKIFCLLFLSGILGIAYLKFKPVVFLGDYLLKIVLGISITGLIFAVISNFKVGNPTNGLLSSISYEVYILHDTVFWF